MISKKLDSDFDTNTQTPLKKVTLDIGKRYYHNTEKPIHLFLWNKFKPEKDVKIKPYASCSWWVEKKPVSWDTTQMCVRYHKKLNWYDRSAALSGKTKKKNGNKKNQKVSSDPKWENLWTSAHQLDVLIGASLHSIYIVLIIWTVGLVKVNNTV